MLRDPFQIASYAFCVFSIKYAKKNVIFPFFLCVRSQLLYVELHHLSWQREWEDIKPWCDALTSPGSPVFRGFLLIPSVVPVKKKSCIGIIYKNESIIIMSSTVINFDFLSHIVPALSLGSRHCQFWTYGWVFLLSCIGSCFYVKNHKEKSLAEFKWIFTPSKLIGRSDTVI